MGSVRDRIAIFESIANQKEQLGSEDGSQHLPVEIIVTPVTPTPRQDEEEEDNLPHSDDDKAHEKEPKEKYEGAPGSQSESDGSDDDDDADDGKPRKPRKVRRTTDKITKTSYHIKKEGREGFDGDEGDEGETTGYNVPSVTIEQPHDLEHEDDYQKTTVTTVTTSMREVPEDRESETHADLESETESIGEDGQPIKRRKVRRITETVTETSYHVKKEGKEDEEAGHPHQTGELTEQDDGRSLETEHADEGEHVEHLSPPASPVPLHEHVEDERTTFVHDDELKAASEPREEYSGSEVESINSDGQPVRRKKVRHTRETITSSSYHVKKEGKEDENTETAHETEGLLGRDGEGALEQVHVVEGDHVEHLSPPASPVPLHEHIEDEKTTFVHDDELGGAHDQEEDYSGSEVESINSDGQPIRRKKVRHTRETITSTSYHVKKEGKQSDLEQPSEQDSHDFGEEHRERPQSADETDETIKATTAAPPPNVLADDDRHQTESLETGYEKKEVSEEEMETIEPSEAEYEDTSKLAQLRTSPTETKQQKLPTEGMTDSFYAVSDESEVEEVKLAEIRTTSSDDFSPVKHTAGEYEQPAKEYEEISESAEIRHSDSRDLMTTSVYAESDEGASEGTKFAEIRKSPSDEELEHHKKIAGTVDTEPHREASPELSEKFGDIAKTAGMVAGGVIAAPFALAALGAKGIYDKLTDQDTTDDTTTDTYEHHERYEQTQRESPIDEHHLLRESPLPETAVEEHAYPQEERHEHFEETEHHELLKESPQPESPIEDREQTHPEEAVVYEEHHEHFEETHRESPADEHHLLRESPLPEAAVEEHAYPQEEHHEHFGEAEHHELLKESPQPESPVDDREQTHPEETIVHEVHQEHYEETHRKSPADEHHLLRESPLPEAAVEEHAYPQEEHHEHFEEAEHHELLEESPQPESPIDDREQTHPEEAVVYEEHHEHFEETHRESPADEHHFLRESPLPEAAVEEHAYPHEEHHEHFEEAEHHELLKESPQPESPVDDREQTHPEETIVHEIHQEHYEETHRESPADEHHLLRESPLPEAAVEEHAYPQEEHHEHFEEAEHHELLTESPQPESPVDDREQTHPEETIVHEVHQEHYEETLRESPVDEHHLLRESPLPETAVEKHAYPQEEHHEHFEEEEHHKLLKESLQPESPVDDREHTHPEGTVVHEEHHTQYEETYREEAEEHESEEKSFGDKLTGFAKKAGLVAGGVIAAPIALAALGAKEAYDTLKQKQTEDDLEEHYEHESSQSQYASEHTEHFEEAQHEYPEDEHRFVPESPQAESPLVEERQFMYEPEEKDHEQFEDIVGKSRIEEHDVVKESPQPEFPIVAEHELATEPGHLEHYEHYEKTQQKSPVDEQHFVPESPQPESPIVAEHELVTEPGHLEHYEHYEETQQKSPVDEHHFVPESPQAESPIAAERQFMHESEERDHKQFEDILQKSQIEEPDFVKEFPQPESPIVAEHELVSEPGHLEHYEHHEETEQKSPVDEHNFVPESPQAASPIAAERQFMHESEERDHKQFEDIPQKSIQEPDFVKESPQPEFPIVAEHELATEPGHLEHYEHYEETQQKSPVDEHHFVPESPQAESPIAAERQFMHESEERDHEQFEDILQKSQIGEHDLVKEPTQPESPIVAEHELVTDSGHLEHYEHYEETQQKSPVDEHHFVPESPQVESQIAAERQFMHEPEEREHEQLEDILQKSQIGEHDLVKEPTQPESPIVAEHELVTEPGHVEHYEHYEETQQESPVDEHHFVPESPQAESPIAAERQFMHESEERDHEQFEDILQKSQIGEHDLVKEPTQPESPIVAEHELVTDSGHLEHYEHYEETQQKSPVDEHHFVPESPQAESPIAAERQFMHESEERDHEQFEDILQKSQIGEHDLVKEPTQPESPIVAEHELVTEPGHVEHYEHYEETQQESPVDEHHFVPESPQAESPIASGREFAHEPDHQEHYEHLEESEQRSPVEEQHFVKESPQAESPIASEREFSQKPDHKEHYEHYEETQQRSPVEEQHLRKESPLEESPIATERELAHHEPERREENEHLEDIQQKYSDDEPHSLQEQVMTAYAEENLGRPDDEMESGTTDERSFGDKLTGFSKKAGLVAGGVIAAPIALAALGAKEAYDSLKHHQEEDDNGKAEYEQRSEKTTSPVGKELSPQAESPIVSEREFSQKPDHQEHYEHYEETEQRSPVEEQHFVKISPQAESPIASAREFMHEPDHQEHYEHYEETESRSPVGEQHFVKESPQAESPIVSEREFSQKPDHQEHYEHYEEAEQRSPVEEQHFVKESPQAESPVASEREFSQKPDHQEHYEHYEATQQRSPVEEQHFVKESPQADSPIVSEREFAHEPDHQEHYEHYEETEQRSPVEEQLFVKESPQAESPNASEREFMHEPDHQEHYEHYEETERRSPVGEQHFVKEAPQESPTASEREFSQKPDHQEHYEHYEATQQRSPVEEQLFVKESPQAESPNASEREFMHEPDHQEHYEHYEETQQRSPVEEQLFVKESPQADSPIASEREFANEPDHQEHYEHFEEAEQRSPVEEQHFVKESPQAESPIASEREFMHETDHQENYEHYEETETRSPVEEQLFVKESPQADSPIASEREFANEPDHQEHYEHYEESERRSPVEEQHFVKESSQAESPIASEREFMHETDHQENYEHYEETETRSPVEEQHFVKDSHQAESPIASEREFMHEPDHQEHYEHYEETQQRSPVEEQLFVKESPQAESPIASEREFMHEPDHQEHYEHYEETKRRSPVPFVEKSPESPIASEREFMQDPDHHEHYEHFEETQQRSPVEEQLFVKESPQAESPIALEQEFAHEPDHQEHYEHYEEPQQTSPVEEQHFVKESPQAESPISSERELAHEPDHQEHYKHFEETQQRSPVGEVGEQHFVEESPQAESPYYGEQPNRSQEDMEEGPTDGRSFGDKLTGFAKKAGLVAGGVIAAPIALAALGAKEAYDSLKKSGGEDDQFDDKTQEEFPIIRKDSNIPEDSLQYERHENYEDSQKNSDVGARLFEKEVPQAESPTVDARVYTTADSVQEHYEHHEETQRESPADQHHFEKEVPQAESPTVDARVYTSADSVQEHYEHHEETQRESPADQHHFEKEVPQAESPVSSGVYTSVDSVHEQLEHHEETHRESPVDQHHFEKEVPQAESPTVDAHVYAPEDSVQQRYEHHEGTQRESPVDQHHFEKEVPQAESPVDAGVYTPVQEHYEHIEETQRESPVDQHHFVKEVPQAESPTVDARVYTPEDFVQEQYEHHEETQRESPVDQHQFEKGHEETQRESPVDQHHFVKEVPQAESPTFDSRVYTPEDSVQEHYEGTQDEYPIDKRDATEYTETTITTVITTFEEPIDYERDEQALSPNQDAHREDRAYTPEESVQEHRDHHEKTELETPVDQQHFGKEEPQAESPIVEDRAHCLEDSVQGHHEDESPTVEHRTYTPEDSIEKHHEHFESHVDRGDASEHTETTITTVITTIEAPIDHEKDDQSLYSDQDAHREVPTFSSSDVSTTITASEEPQTPEKEYSPALTSPKTDIENAQYANPEQEAHPIEYTETTVTMTTTKTAGAPFSMDQRDSSPEIEKRLPEVVAESPDVEAFGRIADQILAESIKDLDNIRESDDEEDTSHLMKRKISNEDENVVETSPLEDSQSGTEKSPSFGSKVFGFAKKAGMIAGGAVAAPVALAALGAKHTYDAIKNKGSTETGYTEVPTEEDHSARDNESESEEEQDLQSQHYTTQEPTTNIIPSENYGQESQFERPISPALHELDQSRAEEHKLDTSATTLIGYAHDEHEATFEEQPHRSPSSDAATEGGHVIPSEDYEQESQFERPISPADHEDHELAQNTTEEHQVGTLKEREIGYEHDEPEATFEEQQLQSPSVESVTDATHIIQSENYDQEAQFERPGSPADAREHELEEPTTEEHQLDTSAQREIGFEHDEHKATFEEQLQSPSSESATEAAHVIPSEDYEQESEFERPSSPADHREHELEQPTVGEHQLATFAQREIGFEHDEPEATFEEQQLQSPSAESVTDATHIIQSENYDQEAQFERPGSPADAREHELEEPTTEEHQLDTSAQREIGFEHDEHKATFEEQLQSPSSESAIEAAHVIPSEDYEQESEFERPSSPADHRVHDLEQPTTEEHKLDTSAQREIGFEHDEHEATFEAQQQSPSSESATEAAHVIPSEDYEQESEFERPSSPADHREPELEEPTVEEHQLATSAQREIGFEHDEHEATIGEQQQSPSTETAAEAAHVIPSEDYEQESLFERPISPADHEEHELEQYTTEHQVDTSKEREIGYEHHEHEATFGEQQLRSPAESVTGATHIIQSEDYDQESQFERPISPADHEEHELAQPTTEEQNFDTTSQGVIGFEHDEHDATFGEQQQRPPSSESTTRAAHVILSEDYEQESQFERPISPADHEKYELVDTTTEEPIGTPSRPELELQYNDQETADLKQVHEDSTQSIIADSQKTAGLVAGGVLGAPVVFGAYGVVELYENVSEPTKIETRSEPTTDLRAVSPSDQEEHELEQPTREEHKLDTSSQGVIGFEHDEHDATFEEQQQRPPSSESATGAAHVIPSDEYDQESQFERPISPVDHTRAEQVGAATQQELELYQREHEPTSLSETPEDSAGNKIIDFAKKAGLVAGGVLAAPVVLGAYGMKELYAAVSETSEEPKLDTAEHRNLGYEHDEHDATFEEQQQRPPSSVSATEAAHVIPSEDYEQESQFERPISPADHEEHALEHPTTEEHNLDTSPQGVIGFEHDEHDATFEAQQQRPPSSESATGAAHVIPSDEYDQESQFERPIYPADHEEHELEQPTTEEHKLDTSSQGVIGYKHDEHDATFEEQQQRPPSSESTTEAAHVIPSEDYEQESQFERPISPADYEEHEIEQPTTEEHKLETSAPTEIGYDHDERNVTFGEQEQRPPFSESTTEAAHVIPSEDYEQEVQFERPISPGDYEEHELAQHTTEEHKLDTSSQGEIVYEHDEHDATFEEQQQRPPSSESTTEAAHVIPSEDYEQESQFERPISPGDYEEHELEHPTTEEHNLDTSPQGVIGFEHDEHDATFEEQQQRPPSSESTTEAAHVIPSEDYEQESQFERPISPGDYEEHELEQPTTEEHKLETSAPTEIGYEQDEHDATFEEQQQRPPSSESATGAVHVITPEGYEQESQFERPNSADHEEHELVETETADSKVADSTKMADLVAGGVLVAPVVFGAYGVVALYEDVSEPARIETQSEPTTDFDNIDSAAYENVARMNLTDPEHYESSTKQSEVKLSSEDDETKNIANDSDWKVFNSKGEVVEEFSAQLAEDVITGATEETSSPQPPRKLLKQESSNEIRMEPEVDYQSDLQEKLDILAAQSRNDLPILKEEEEGLSILHEEHEVEEDLPTPDTQVVNESAAKLVDDVLNAITTEEASTQPSSDFVTATEQSKDYETCVTSQTDTFQSAQQWTSQDSEYTTAPSDSTSRPDTREELVEPSTPTVLVSPIEPERPFSASDRPGIPFVFKQFDTDSKRSTPDVTLQIEGEDDELEGALQTSASGVLQLPDMDPGRPTSPIPPRRTDSGIFIGTKQPEDTITVIQCMTPDILDATEEKVNPLLRKKLPGSSETSIHDRAMEIEDISSQYSRQISDVSSSSQADTVIQNEQYEEPIDITEELLASQIGADSIDSLDKVSMKSGGSGKRYSTSRRSSGASAKTPEREAVDFEQFGETEETVLKTEPEDVAANFEITEETPASPDAENIEETYETFTQEEVQSLEPELETLHEEPEDSDSLNGSGSSVGAPVDTIALLGKYKHMSSDNISESSLQEFERIEQAVINKGESSLTSSELELYLAGTAGRLIRSGEGSTNSLTEFEKLEQEVGKESPPQEDVMMLSDIREESEAEDMSVRDDEEGDNDSVSDVKIVPVNEDEERIVTPTALSNADSIEKDIDMISSVHLLETSTDSLEPTGAAVLSTQRRDSLEETSLAEYEVISKMNESMRDSLENIPHDTDSLLEGASQDVLTSQDTQGLLSGDTVGTYQEHDDDKDSLTGEMDTMLSSYPTTLTTFETTQVKDDGTVETISRRVETRVRDPVMSHVQFTGTESEERVKQLPVEEQFETVDEEGNVTRTIVKRQSPQHH